MTRQSGLKAHGHGQGCAAADYDNDGDQDVVVATVMGLVICENDGHGRFRRRIVKLTPEAPPMSLAAADFDSEEAKRRGKVKAMLAGGGLEKDDEDDDSDPVVEEGFAGDLGFETLGNVGGFEDSEHGYRIGRRDQCAEEKAIEIVEFAAESDEEKEKSAKNPQEQEGSKSTNNKTANAENVQRESQESKEGGESENAVAVGSDSTDSKKTLDNAKDEPMEIGGQE